MILVGAGVLGAATLGSAAGAGPGSAPSDPSFAVVTLGANEHPGAEHRETPPATDPVIDAAPSGPGRQESAPTECQAVPPSTAPVTPVHPEAGDSIPPIAVPLRRPAAVFLGDSYTSGYVGAGMGPDGWPAIVASSYDWRMVNLAVPGTGFVNPGWTDQPMGTQIADVIRLRPGVVVIAGGHNDRRYGTARASVAADDVIDRLRAALPDAILVVIGPIWQDGSPAASVVGLRNHLRSKAAEVGAAFIDPLAGRWFGGSNQRFIGSDGTHPTNAGHEHIARLVLAALRTDPRFAPSPVGTPATTPLPAPTDAPWDPAGRSVIGPACAS